MHQENKKRLVKSRAGSDYSYTDSGWGNTPNPASRTSIGTKEDERLKGSEDSVDV